MHVKQTVCKVRPSRGVWRHAPQKKIAARRLNLVGFWQLADYPTLVFKITAFLNLVIVNWSYTSNYMYDIKFWGGGGEIPDLSVLPPLYETLPLVKQYD